MTRDEHGAITALELPQAGVALRDAAGQPLEDPEDDSEGLALLADGSLVISFELDARVTHYGIDGSLLDTFPVAKEFAALAENWGLEAAAVAPDGSIYTMPEGDGQGISSFPVFRYRGGAWDQPFVLPEDHTWRPVGADFGPDGRLYILERDYWGLVGFQSRLRRIALDGDKVAGDEVLFSTRAGRFDNLEGLSIWQDKAGATHATMVSDDNFLFTQKTQFVDYLIAD